MAYVFVGQRVSFYYICMVGASGSKIFKVLLIIKYQLFYIHVSLSALPSMIEIVYDIS